MPCDIAAEVISNTPLSNDYNVLALAAPAIAETATPGQFVMVKAAAGHDPLLRRPFSVFEILNNGAGLPIGFSLLNKRIGPCSALWASHSHSWNLQRKRGWWPVASALRPLPRWRAR
jgi:NAD(P)H-flavin reductase